jgi:putative FmdB family regulatory protein
MPTYDYQCGKCRKEFSREQRITEPPVKTCPSCKSRQVKRLLSAPGFILKGGGWYADLYSSGKKSSGSEGGGSGGEGTSGSGASSGESTASAASESGSGKSSDSASSSSSSTRKGGKGKSKASAA